MKFKKWEIALAAALLASMALGFLTAEQRELESKLIRLHVVANSDSEYDQRLKLEVRDRVLEELEPLLAGCADRREAEKRLAASLGRVEAAAESRMAELGADYASSASLSGEYFPTVEYDGFTLPAGKYAALRVVIGDGEGRNWWCVVFPPLCMTAAVDAPGFEELGLSRETAALIAGDTSGCTVRFRILEWISRLKRLIF